MWLRTYRSISTESQPWIGPDIWDRMRELVNDFHGDYEITVENRDDFDGGLHSPIYSLKRVKDLTHYPNLDWFPVRPNHVDRIVGLDF